jgi:hypothetical protein
MEWVRTHLPGLVLLVLFLGMMVWILRTSAGENKKDE